MLLFASFGCRKANQTEKLLHSYVFLCLNNCATTS